MTKLAKNYKNEEVLRILKKNYEDFEKSDVIEYGEYVFIEKRVLKIVSRSARGLLTLSLPTFDQKEEAKKTFEKEVIRKEIQSAQKRANELAEIIRKEVVAFYSENMNTEELRVVKINRSKSKWYSNNELNMVSEYHFCVPSAVINEALELNSIRNSMNGMMTFDFIASKGAYIKVANTDHSNIHHGSGTTYSLVV